ncbi:MAG: T9SS type A sorting domain-containing protein [Ignavibacteriaceae bacterium]|nr:T9SS type A sorting domain-containing protein [Ignavibacteriaceae bacterium]
MRIFFKPLFFLLLFLLNITVVSQVVPSRSQNFPSSGVPDTLRILAILVEFQTDNDRTTYGDGKFNSIYSTNYGNTILDPLPHDSAYFASHLEFAKNYYHKNSRGKMAVEYTILPEIITVSNTMRNYSPPVKSNDFKPIVDFSIESWQKADTLYPNFDFSGYDLYVIFHAGVGRDISVPGSLGNERDLPSIYMGLDLYRKYYGTSYQGIQLRNGSQRVTNSAILPQTQNREVDLLTGKSLFEITINGLLVATIGSRLGLPDLFNTETGLSAIGRFGLMDGQSIFAYNGLFPPELSAWEKIYLGWATPVELNTVAGAASLAASGVANASDTVILKIPINSSEYFLVENRQRDSKGDGARLLIKNGNSVSTKVFTSDTSGFYSYSTEQIDGVVIDVDEFDWSLPGSGVLIWHINEEVIASKKSSNTINNDKNNKGVDLEEADGIQDIGEQFTTIFGDIITAEGSEDDFWFKGNESELFKNTFNSKSRPDSRSSSGAGSLISLSDFSENANRIYFRFKTGDDNIIPMADRKINSVTKTSDLTGVVYSGENLFYFTSSDTLYILDENGNVKFTTPGFSEFPVASSEYNSSLYLSGVKSGRLNLLEYSSNATLMNVQLTSPITASAVMRHTATEMNKVLVGAAGKVYTLELPASPGSSPVIRDSILIGGSESVLQIASAETYFSFAAAAPGNDYFNVYDNLGNSVRVSGTFNKLSIYKQTDTDYRIVILSDKNMVTVIEKGKIESQFSLGNMQSEDFYLSPSGSDGMVYIHYLSGKKLHKVNIYGASAQNFPYYDSKDTDLNGHILSADFSSAGGSELFFMTGEGELSGINSLTGGIFSPFPLSFNKSKSYGLGISQSTTKTVLAVSDSAGYFRSYELKYPIMKIIWTGKYGDHRNSSFAGSGNAVSPASQLLSEKLTYNYPNPVYTGTTYIRYVVNEDSRINIKIFDMAGDLVADLSDFAPANYEKEHPWNIDNIQSGIYIAKVTATSGSGKTGSQTIKIAVIK